MTYQLRKPARHRAASPAETATRQTFAAAASTGVAAARASTTLALSMMVALRYLEGRPRQPAAAAAAIPDAVLS